MYSWSDQYSKFKYFIKNRIFFHEFHLKEMRGGTNFLLDSFVVQIYTKNVDENITLKAFSNYYPV
jgi:hypothetical protein